LPVGVLFFVVKPTICDAAIDNYLRPAKSVRIDEPERIVEGVRISIPTVGMK